MKLRQKINKPLCKKNSGKKLKQNYIPRSEIIGITIGHNSEAGLDAYDSGNEEQQRAISNAIDTVNKDPVHFQRSHSKPWVIFPNNERAKNTTFNFLDQNWASPKSKNYHLHNYTAKFYNSENSVQHQNHNRERKRCVTYSSDSSDE